jgi:hypothetical protein
MGCHTPAASPGRPAALRRIVGSRAYHQANAKLAALDRRAANLRAHQLHTLTTQLARRYGTVVVEDLDVAAWRAGWAVGRFAAGSRRPASVRFGRC